MQSIVRRRGDLNSSFTVRVPFHPSDIAFTTRFTPSRRYVLALRLAHIPPCATSNECHCLTVTEGLYYILLESTSQEGSGIVTHPHIQQYKV
jgi:hypothetical protein